MNEIKKISYNNFLETLDFNILEDILNINCKEKFKYNIKDDLKTNINKYFKLSYKYILNGCISGICWGINYTTDYNRYFNMNIKDDYRQEYIFNKIRNIDYIECSYCEGIYNLYLYNKNNYTILDNIYLFEKVILKDRTKYYRLEQMKDLNIKDKFKIVLLELDEYLNNIEEGESLTKIEDIRLYYSIFWKYDSIRSDYIINKVNYYRNKKEEYQDNEEPFIYNCQYNYFNFLGGFFHSHKIKYYRFEQMKDLNIKDKFKLVLVEFNEVLNKIEDGEHDTKIEHINIYYEDDIDRIRGDYIEHKVEYYREKKKIYYFEYNYYKLLRAFYWDYCDLNCEKYRKYFKRASYLENKTIRKIFNK